MRRTDNQVSISDLYLAYRKAKAEAFHENTHYHAVAFTKFEQDLHRNLTALQKRMNVSGRSTHLES
jgi:hypothetical protein